MQNFEVLDSLSELKIRVYGKTIEDLFKTALRAMFECIEPVYMQTAQETKHNIRVSAQDHNLLLIDFLAQALVYADSLNEAFYDLDFKELSQEKLTAEIIGKRVSSFAIEIKAVTYHNVNIQERNGKLTTEILFDI